MEDENILSEKLDGATPGSYTNEPVEGAGGPVKDRKADVKKKVDPVADTVAKPPLSESEKADDEKDEDGEKADKEDEKEDLKEKVLSVFEGVELSEDAKRKLAIVFEAAVAAEVSKLVESKIDEIKAELKEAHDAELSALKETHDAEKATLEENLETFMQDASNKWLEENKIAIQDAKTVEIAESFVNSLKDLFVEHEIIADVDASQVIASLEEEIETANSRANDAILESINSRKELNEIKAQLAFAEVSEGLTTSQVDKLRVLSAKLVMEDVEAFKTDLVSIKETFFAIPVNLKEESNEDPVVTDSAEAPTMISEDFIVNELVKAIKARNNR